MTREACAGERKEETMSETKCQVYSWRASELPAVKAHLTEMSSPGMCIVDTIDVDPNFGTFNV